MSKMQITKRSVSSDTSVKYLFELNDGQHIEAVYIPQTDGLNFCISTQVGCSNRCRHCATGRMEYIRDLTAEEITEEVSILLNDHTSTPSSGKVLLMGMGEPLLNFNNTVKAINEFTRIIPIESKYETIISTSGILPGIIRLMSENVNARLAITIGSIFDEKREWLLVPAGKLYPLSEILSAGQAYAKSRGNSIILNYPLIKDFNDTIDETKALADLLKPISCEVHVIPFNEFEGSSLKSPSRETIANFSSALLSLGIRVVTKPSFGIDINAGCGQLIAKFETYPKVFQQD